jgi:hypothetical protein
MVLKSHWTFLEVLESFMFLDVVEVPKKFSQVLEGS